MSSDGQYQLPDGSSVPSASIDECCEVLHDAYELAADEAGWATQEASRKPWADLPEPNKAAMRAGVAALICHLFPRRYIIGAGLLVEPPTYLETVLAKSEQS